MAIASVVGNANMSARADSRVETLAARENARVQSTAVVVARRCSPSLVVARRRSPSFAVLRSQYLILIASSTRKFAAVVRRDHTMTIDLSHAVDDDDDNDGYRSLARAAAAAAAAATVAAAAVARGQSAIVNKSAAAAQTRRSPSIARHALAGVCSWNATRRPAMTARRVPPLRSRVLSARASIATARALAAIAFSSRLASRVFSTLAPSTQIFGCALSTARAHESIEAALWRVQTRNTALLERESTAAVHKTASQRPRAPPPSPPPSAPHG